MGFSENPMEEDEWDLATMHELDRMEAEAVAAKRLTQQAATTISVCTRHSTMDDWDAAGAMLYQPTNNNSRKRSPVPKVRSQQQEIDRLSTELSFKDQELMDAKRACLEKDEQLKKALVSSSALQEELNAMKKRAMNKHASPAKPKKSAVAPEPTAVLKARTSDSSGCGSPGPSNDAASQWGRHSINEAKLASLAYDTELSCKLQTVWRPQSCATHLLATCRPELYTLQTSSNGAELHEALAAVASGCRDPHTLMDPLLLFCKSEEMSIVKCALRVLRCLFQHDASGSDKEMHQDAEVKGLGWELCATERQVVFASARIVRGSSETRIPVRSDRVWPESSLNTFLECSLHLALNTKDRSVRFEAVLLINMLVLQADTYSGRLWIGTTVLKAGLASLLEKGTGVDVQISVARIALLLFNCPELLRHCCHEQPNDVSKHGQELLRALSTCLTQNGRNSQDRALRKSALQVLAFVLQTSKNGPAVLVHDVGTPGFVLGQLISFLDYELEGHVEDERFSVLQEALTVLYQLALHSVLSGTVVTFLVSDAATSRRSLNVVNKLVTLGLKKSGRKICSPDVETMARQLKCKLLTVISSCLADCVTVL